MADTLKRKPLLPIIHSSKALNLAGNDEDGRVRSFYVLAHRGANPIESDFHMQARLGFRRTRQNNLRLRPIEWVQQIESMGIGSSPSRRAANKERKKARKPTEAGKIDAMKRLELEFEELLTPSDPQDRLVRKQKSLPRRPSPPRSVPVAGATSPRGASSPKKTAPPVPVVKAAVSPQCGLSSPGRARSSPPDSAGNECFVVDDSMGVTLSTFAKVSDAAVGSAICSALEEESNDDLAQSVELLGNSMMDSPCSSPIKSTRSAGSFQGCSSSPLLPAPDCSSARSPSFVAPFSTSWAHRPSVGSWLKARTSRYCEET
jgi:hypothetical protein